MAVLDTSFLIALERGDAHAWGRMEALQARAAPLRVPAAVWVEYLFAMKAPVRADAIATLEGAVSFEPFSRALADEAARLQHDLKRAGKPLGWHDLQVAATALHHREPVVSNDVAFDGVPGLDRLGH